jgi:glycosyltransferase involved in cell wall biosynthesis
LPEKTKISAIIPCFNEEKNIEKALQSVQFCDEILVIDSYSTDKTLDIVKKYTDFIVQHEYENSAAQKNRAIPMVHNEWIVLLDADEYLPESLQKEIIETVNRNPKEVAFWIYRQNYFMNKKMNYSGLQGDKVIRLFRKSKCRYENKHVHAEIMADGKVGFLKNKIVHNTYKGIDNHITKLNRYATWQAKDYDKKTGSLTPYHFFVKPAFRFMKHYVIKLGFLDGVPGLTYSFLASYAVFMRYVKLWLLRRNLT